MRDTAQQLIASIDAELARSGLSADERLQFIHAEERALATVADNEASIREEDERSFARVAAAGVTIAVKAVLLGYLAREGKPPTSPLKTGI